MKRKYESNDHAQAVTKEVMWLAWNACGGPREMGFMQDKPDADKDAVWKQAFERRDYPGMNGGHWERINADYVFGRMMKLRLSVEGNVINVPESEPHPSYQGWCHRYKTYAKLFDAAEAAVLKERT